MASGPLIFNPPVGGGPDAWLLDGEEVLVGGGLGGGDVVCAHASMPQENTASKNVQLLIQNVDSIPPTLAREARGTARAKAHTTAARRRPF